ncbi:hypothetical protein P4306_31325, partial [Bacillus thuringiensis]|nr:hypothetical protein [Bacillus thuringiensis]
LEQYQFVSKNILIPHQLKQSFLPLLKMIHINEQIQYLCNKKTKGILSTDKMPLVSPISNTLWN